MTVGRLRYVYVLRSESNPAPHYVGITANMDGRLEWHNSGPSGYTRAYRPWRLVVQLEFDDVILPRDSPACAAA